jgi:hypothetical protein
MSTLIFRCPRTGYNVQAYLASTPDPVEHVYVSLPCTACRQTHLVNPVSREVLGAARAPPA